MATTVEASVAAPQVKLFLGHPRGLAYLIFAEGWERFSYYGMLALLVLYLGQYLLLPGHVEHVAGFAAFRETIESVTGPLSPAALASQIYGLYAGFVYLTPIAGGLVADRLLGRTMTITIGAILMALGHFLMAFDVSFLAALACLLIGVGCFKGNLSSQIGELYAPGDLRRADAFQILLLGINIAATASPLICGTLGQKVAWHWGFGAAGIGMLVGLVVYLSGRRWLPPDRRAGHHSPNAAAVVSPPKLAPGDGITVLVLVGLLPALTLSAIGNQQIGNAYTVWGNTNYDLNLFGWAMPVTWLQSLDTVVSSVTILLAMAFWRWWAKSRPEPDEITKLAIGALIAAAAPLILALASFREAASGEKVGLAWALGFHFVNDIGFANVFPVGLALFSRAAPKAVGGLLIGAYFLHLFACNLAVGWLGGLLERMAATQFWLLHAGLVAAGAGIMLLFRVFFGHRLAPTVDPEAKAAG
ncbi:MAG: peptide MFS transporter [Aliidongia sp.]